MILKIAMKKVLLITLALILAMGSLAFTACSDDSQGLKIDDPAPNFNLKDLNGQSVSLKSYRGKTVVLHFWDTSFSACVAEMPYFQELNTEWSQKGIALLTIDVQEGSDTVKTFMQENNYTFPVLLDSESEVVGKYYLYYIPATLIIDKEGNLKYKVEGSFKNKEAIVNQLGSFLGN